MSRTRILFITGKLAEPALRRTVDAIAAQAQFDYGVAILPITVAALATTPWIARHLQPEEDFDRILIPGLCQGELDVLARAWNRGGIERGPKDLRDLPEFFGSKRAKNETYGGYDMQILAEINHAPRLPRAELLARAKAAKADGADLIDLGCDPHSTWADVGAAVRMLRDEGLRVSLDSFDPREAELASTAGVELILSVNHTNRDQAKNWGCEVVVVPDVPTDLASIEKTVETLTKAGVRFRIDPVLEPIAFGFAASLGRYLEVRRRYPDAEMMMGVGNLTELTDVDSAGVNVLLLGFCQELGIRSVLTTEVVNWCRSCVRELDLARRLVFHAVKEQVLPKHLEPNLVLLRDPKVKEFGPAFLTELAAKIVDRNFRLFAEAGRLHAINDKMHAQASDAFDLFQEMRRHENIDAEHAFYLGYELAKAMTALTLGKNYVQDQSLRWGFLTRPETNQPPDHTV